MANPVLYMNNTNANLQVGSYVIPSQKVFTYDWDDYKLTIGGANINKVVGTVSTGAINTHLSNGTIEPIYSISNSMGLVSSVGGATWDGNEVVPGNYVSPGYAFKLRRDAQVFKGTQYQFTLPGQANVLVSGHSSVGASYRQRTHITGVEASVHQQSLIVGNYPRNFGKVIELTGGEWWIDTGAGMDDFSGRYTTALIINYTG